ncbi:phosphatidylinositol-binding protein scs2 [Serendipita sp. 397]|nr:phosphatidylinositol-binding protein scs2 [Serendipita sp. 397]
MSVSLDPSSQLAFRKPFNTLGKQILHIYNNNAQPVAFKVKTTAPKLYCVRPNAGRIEPGMHVDVSGTATHHPPSERVQAPDHHSDSAAATNEGRSSAFCEVQRQVPCPKPRNSAR